MYDIHIKRDQETYLCARYGEQIAPRPREREFALATLNSPIARYMRVFGRRAKYLENSDSDELAVKLCSVPHPLACSSLWSPADLGPILSLRDLAVFSCSRRTGFQLPK